VILQLQISPFPFDLVKEEMQKYPRASVLCNTGFCSIEAMDMPGMLENIVLQKPWTSQKCYTGFCSIEAMDMPGMLQRILFYRSHGHLRNVTYDLLYKSCVTFLGCPWLL
jgi:hypothetical protein